MDNDEIQKIVAQYRSPLSEKLGVKEPPLANSEASDDCGKALGSDGFFLFSGVYAQSYGRCSRSYCKRVYLLVRVTYGEKVVERYMQMRIPKDSVLPVVFAFGTVYTGWSVNKIEEMDLSKPYLRTRTFNDFETESARSIGKDSELKFSTGVVGVHIRKNYRGKVKPEITRTQLDDGSFIVEYSERK